MAPAGRSADRRVRSTPAWRWRRGVRYAHDRLTLLLAVLSGVCLLIALRCLQRIGPPPRFAIEALWVHERRALVHVLAASTLVAAVASALAILMGRKRWLILILWGAGTLIALSQFSDQLEVVARVVIRQMA